jgi:hypothetical protein
MPLLLLLVLAAVPRGDPENLSIRLGSAGVLVEAKRQLAGHQPTQPEQRIIAAELRRRNASLASSQGGRPVAPAA